MCRIHMHSHAFTFTGRERHFRGLQVVRLTSVGTGILQLQEVCVYFGWG